MADTLNKLILLDKCVAGDFQTFVDLCGNIYDGFNCLYTVVKNNQSNVDLSSNITYEKQTDNSATFTMKKCSDKELDIKAIKGIKISQSGNGTSLALNIEVMKE